MIDTEMIAMLKANGPAAGMLIVGWWLIQKLLTGFSTAIALQREDFAKALTDQRQDFLAELRHHRTAATKVAMNLLLLSLVFLTGCTPGQGGTVGDFSLVTPLGSIAWKTWVVTPATTEASQAPPSVPLPTQLYKIVPATP